MISLRKLDNRKVGRIMQSESKDSRTRSNDVPGQKMDVAAPAGSTFALPPPFLLFRPSVDWMMVIALVRAWYLYSVYVFEC